MIVLCNVFDFVFRYYYEIEDYKRSLAEEEKRKAKEDEEMRGWRDSDLRAAAEGKGREAPIEMEQGVDRGKNKEMSQLDPASLKQQQRQGPGKSVGT